MILVEAENLDGALAVAAELQELEVTAAIEVRPVLGQDRLGRSLVELMPDEAEAHALLALMLLGHARNTARFRNAELVLLDDQDRAFSDQNQIDEGRERISVRARARRTPLP